MTTKFKVGDTVYDRFVFPGLAGKVIDIDISPDGRLDTYPVIVSVNDSDRRISYKADGSYDDHYGPSLSLADYTLEGFTQDRPWEPVIGQWVAVRNSEDATWIIAKFKELKPSGKIVVYEYNKIWFDVCKPLEDFINEHKR